MHIHRLCGHKGGGRSAQINVDSTEHHLKASARFHKCCRQVQTEVVSNSRNKIYQTWPKPFSGVLYMWYHRLVDFIWVMLFRPKWGQWRGHLKILQTFSMDGTSSNVKTLQLDNLLPVVVGPKSIEWTQHQFSCGQHHNHVRELCEHHDLISPWAKDLPWQQCEQATFFRLTTN